MNSSLDVFNTPQGHGYAAEQMNHTQAVLLGRKPEIVGTNNEKNGPDCFVNNQYKYIVYGMPMAVELPADQYDVAEF